MYFNYREGEKHLKAKEHLYQLLLEQRVQIFDQDNEGYEIFKGKHKNEFLHQESFVMDYSSYALLSNDNPVCKNLIKNPMCDQKGYYGAFKDLPCHKCVKGNVDKDKIKGSSKYASYRSDISYGYEGLHKVWIEIKDTSGCTLNKISFCKDKGIILLEVGADDVLKLNGFNNVLKVNRLQGYEKVKSSITYDKIKDIVSKTIEEEMFIESRKLYEIIGEISNGSLESKGYVSRLKLDLGITEIENYSIALQKYFKSKSKIYIDANKLNEYKLEEERYIVSIGNTINNVANDLLKNLSEVRYLLLKEFKESLIEILPDGFKSKLKDYYDLNILQTVQVKEIYNHLEKLGIPKTMNKNSKLIISDDLKKEINQII